MKKSWLLVGCMAHRNSGISRCGTWHILHLALYWTMLKVVFLWDGDAWGSMFCGKCRILLLDDVPLSWRPWFGDLCTCICSPAFGTIFSVGWCLISWYVQRFWRWMMLADYRQGAKIVAGAVDLGPSTPSSYMSSPASWRMLTVVFLWDGARAHVRHAGIKDSGRGKRLGT